MDKDIRLNVPKFIQIVQQHPILYNINHSDYKNRNIRCKIWRDVAAQVGLPNGNVAKFKWRNLKDSYVKYRRELIKSEGKDLKKYKNWPWVKYLHFLKPHFGNSETRNTKFEAMVLIDEDSQSEQPVHFLDDSSHCTYNENTENMFTEAPETIAITPEYLQMNENELLFLSYAKQINDFSKKRQITVKMKIAEIMMQAALEELDEDPFAQQ